MKRTTIILSGLLCLSLIGNAYQGFQGLAGQFKTLYQTDANSRETYFSIHHIKEAQAVAKGKGIKVGIMDAYFDTGDYPALYAGGEDFSGDSDALTKSKSHGFSMACVLREIAPECEIYALNISHENEDREVDSLIAAMDWAINNGLDILTLSQAQISDANRARFDEAVNRAIDSGIVTTFIHYDNPRNILPYSTTPYGGDYNREPDVNIFHYDYNSVRTGQLEKFLDSSSVPESGDDVPYFSYSSMSPVLAGFIAILKSVDNTLAPEEYKQLLIDTGYPMEYDGVMDWEDGVSEHTVDIGKAVNTLAGQSR